MVTDYVIDQNIQVYQDLKSSEKKFSEKIRWKTNEPLPRRKHLRDDESTEEVDSDPLSESADEDDFLERKSPRPPGKAKGRKQILDRIQDRKSSENKISHRTIRLGYQIPRPLYPSKVWRAVTAVLRIHDSCKRGEIHYSLRRILVMLYIMASRLSLRHKIFLRKQVRKWVFRKTYIQNHFGYTISDASLWDLTRRFAPVPLGPFLRLNYEQVLRLCSFSRD
jgi:hypothetical protein